MVHVLDNQPTLKAVLDRLHAISLEQESATNGNHFPQALADIVVFEEQLVALDEDKSQAMYLILRAMGATRIVEAGTSYGAHFPLLWLLAAVTANEMPKTENSLPSLVIGTESVPKKAEHALSHVREAFELEGQTPACLSLLQGDLLETLPAAYIADRSIDALLLDIWAPVTLPTLKILLPKLRVGAAVFIDNTFASEARYKDLLDFVRAPKNGFQSSTLPYAGGFEFCVYIGQA